VSSLLKRRWLLVGERAGSVDLVAEPPPPRWFTAVSSTPPDDPTTPARQHTTRISNGVCREKDEAMASQTTRASRAAVSGSVDLSDPAAAVVVVGRRTGSPSDEPADESTSQPLPHPIAAAPDTGSELAAEPDNTSPGGVTRPRQRASRACDACRVGRRGGPSQLPHRPREHPRLTPAPLRDPAAEEDAM